MQIVGIQKTSLIDYPGKMCTTLFTLGCNMKCPYCHNKQISFDFVEAPALLGVADVFSTIEERKSFIDAVSISGGEPTVQKDIVEFCLDIKKKFALLVKIDTNGSKPAVIKKLIESNAVDYIALDIKTSFSRYKESLGVDGKLIYESYNLIKNSKIEHELRMTCFPDFINSDVIDEMLPLLDIKDRLFLQKCNNEQTYDKGQMDLFENQFKEQGYSATGLRM